MPARYSCGAVTERVGAACGLRRSMLPVDGGLMAGPFTRRQGADMGSRRLLEAGVYSDA